MNAVTVDAREFELLLVGKEIRRDLRIQFEPHSIVCRFCVSVHPKGRGPYFSRPHFAFASAENIGLLGKGGQHRTLHVGGTIFHISEEEHEKLNEWLASLPRELK